MLKVNGHALIPNKIGRYIDSYDCGRYRITRDGRTWLVLIHEGDYFVRRGEYPTLRAAAASLA